VLDRDYPVVFANLYIFSLIGLFVALISDLTYTWIDPRIDFEAEGRLMSDVLVDTAVEGVRHRSNGPGSRRSTAALAELQGQPPRLLVAVDFPRAVRAVAVRRADRQRPAADRSYKGEIAVPGAGRLSREMFGGFRRHRLPRSVGAGGDRANGWAVWPPIRYSYRTQQRNAEPAPVEAVLDVCQGRSGAKRYPPAPTILNCTLGNWNWLGTDDQARDVSPASSTASASRCCSA
jgi:hypothetical protein